MIFVIGSFLIVHCVCQQMLMLQKNLVCHYGTSVMMSVVA